MKLDMKGYESVINGIRLRHVNAISVILHCWTNYHQLTFKFVSRNYIKFIGV